MKKTIFAAIIAFILYAILKILIFLTGLNTIVDSENFTMIGISLAFSWSALLYVSGNLNFSIGVNVSWLAIALSVLIFNISEQSFLFWFYLFFFIFPLGFLIKYLFFSSELKKIFSIQITCLAILLVFSLLSTYLLLNF